MVSNIHIQLLCPTVCSKHKGWGKGDVVEPLQDVLLVAKIYICDRIATVRYHKVNELAPYSE